MHSMFDDIDEEVIRIIVDAKEIAVYGLSSVPHKAAHYVSQYLQDQGNFIIPINTNQYIDRILGEKLYRDLMSVPYDYDILLVFRPSNEIPEIVNEYFSAPHQSPLIWFQVGIYDQESYSRVEEAGLRCIMDKCLMVEHQKLVGDGWFKKKE